MDFNEKLSTDSQALAKAFDNAIAQAAQYDDAIEQAGGNPATQIALLEEALAPLDVALAHYAVGAVDWSDSEQNLVEGAYNSANDALADLIERRNAAPEIWENVRVLIGGDSPIMLEPGFGYPQGASSRDCPIAKKVSRLEGDLLVSAPRTAPLLVATGDLQLQQDVNDNEDEINCGCCFTSIEFENIYGGPIRVRVIPEDGDPITEEFTFDSRKGGERKSLRARRDHDKQTVPGGLGACVTIEVTPKNALNGYDTPVASWRICCGDGDVQDGHILERVFPADNETPPRHVTLFRPLRIGKIRSLDPCPERQSGGGVSARGMPAGGIRSIPGIRAEDGSYLYGASCIMRYIPNRGTCRKICFVQGVQRDVRIRFGPQGDLKLSNLSTSGGFKLDRLKSQKTPCYAFSKPIPGGGSEMRDGPTVVNPFGRFKLDGKWVRLPPGSRMLVTWTFRTWVVCLDPPLSILGRFDWKVTLDLIVGKDPRDTSGTVEMNHPRGRTIPTLQGTSELLGRRPTVGASYRANPRSVMWFVRIRL